MDFIDRRDRMLLAGLALALIVVFARPTRYLLDLARDLERSSGLALVPALIILTAVFLFHEWGSGRKRRRARRRPKRTRTRPKHAPWKWSGSSSLARRWGDRWTSRRFATSCSA
jgi:hypothetical protein